MKRHTKFFSIFLGLLLAFTACDMFDDNDQSPEETLQSQLPFSQYIISYWRGLDMGRYQLQWTQQLSGVSGKYLNIDRYQMHGYHNDDIWYFYYEHIYRDLRNMITVATEENARAYRGIARILQAYSLGFMTDTWGDVPHEMAMGYFTQANLPVYDEQQQLYIEIMQLLELAQQDLIAAQQSDGLKPGAAEDPIYGGDLDQWKKAADVIRLRHLLRMGNQAGNYNLPRGQINNRELFSGTHDDMVYHYNQELDQINPHYFFRQVTRAGEFFVDMLLETDDPRTEHFLTQNIYGEYVGKPVGSTTQNASSPGSAIASQTSPTTLIGYTEQKFIEAEVYLMTGDQLLADQAYEEAVISSLRSLDIEDPEWEAEHASVEDVTLEQIMNAKYVALFLNPEVWSDYRRTGFPEIPHYEGDGDAEGIPRRFLYAEEEKNINASNVPSGIDLFTRMWWDVE